MATVIKTGPETYTINVSESSVSGVHAPFQDNQLPSIGETATRNFFATITVVVSDDFAAYARGLCASKIDLGTDIGSSSNAVSILSGMMRAPVPIASAYGVGKIPEMTQAELSSITSNLDGIERGFSTTFTMQVPNGTRMALLFLPDARGFNVELVDMSVGLDLEYDHPFVLTNSFVVANLAEDKTEEGPGDMYAEGSFDDALIYKMEVTEDGLNFAETLTNEMIKAKGSDRVEFLDSYYLLLNEMFWRSDQKFEAMRIGARPSVSHLYGIGVSGRALQVVDIRGMTSRESRPGINLNLSGSTKVVYIYGDIRYPVNPMLSSAKPKFDIISDSEDWTKYGPISPRYIGGDDSGYEPTTIFSWEGRTSASPKILPQIAAELENF